LLNQHLKNIIKNWRLDLLDCHYPYDLVGLQN